ncbi:hypothetical protein DIE11_13055 [Burkholderia sp. Bp9012]|nr:hypothetical protein DIE11_13055 [Burkholderia sp. Bp9012]
MFQHEYIGAAPSPSDIFSVRRPASGVRRPASGVRRPAFGVRRSAFGVRHPASGPRPRSAALRADREPECDRIQPGYASCL